MRLVPPLVAPLVIAAALAAVWVEASAPPRAPAPAPTPLSTAEAGLAAALGAAGAAPLPGLAATQGADGLWRVRGRAPRPAGRAAGWPAPLYAEARALCDAGLERPACWRVGRLELDGAPVAAAPGAPTQAPAASQPEAPR